ncbi:MAG: hypothetical protein QXW97_04615 [Candidatus Pacearchaeota archaeon]
MKYKNYIIIIFFVLFFIILVLNIKAAHYIVGRVNDSKDGISANGREVVLWNPSIGIHDNLTDIIGPLGNSGLNNYYLIDCELLDYPCEIGDILNIKVINNGDNRISYTIPVTVTGASFDRAKDLFLNSPPNATLNFPENHANLTSNILNFNCSGIDLDFNLENITLYGNWSGEWHENETKKAQENFTSLIFTKNLKDGEYEWNCLVRDNLTLSSFSKNNYTFTIDSTPPNITSIKINETIICGTRNVRVNCTLTDNLAGINKVIIEAIKPSGRENYTASLLSGDTYYADIPTNQIGNWTFNCIANDSFGNQANLTSDKLIINSPIELLVNYSEIEFSNYYPLEFETININAKVYNIGCSNVSNLLIGFFKDDPVFGNQIGNNQTISIQSYSNNVSSISWNAEIGFTNIFIFVDINNTYSEVDENDNIKNKTFWLTSWQKIYGNISGIKVLSDYEKFNLSIWLNHTNISGNIFISDSELQINWFSLQAIGINKSGQMANNDFTDIDLLLNTVSFNDSIYKTYTNSGNPKAKSTFLVHQKNIDNVPVINSTNNSNFITGILWDYSKDKGNGEYDTEDKEPLIFVSKLNKGKDGEYGYYDYEISIPVRLRQYDNSEISKIYLYYDLV